MALKFNGGTPMKIDLTHTLGWNKQIGELCDLSVVFNTDRLTGRIRSNVEQQIRCGVQSNYSGNTGWAVSLLLHHSGLPYIQYKNYKYSLGLVLHRFPSTLVARTPTPDSPADVTNGYVHSIIFNAYEKLSSMMLLTQAGDTKRANTRWARQVGAYVNYDGDSREIAIKTYKGSPGCIKEVCAMSFNKGDLNLSTVRKVVLEDIYKPLNIDHTSFADSVFKQEK